MNRPDDGEHLVEDTAVAADLGAAGSAIWSHVPTCIPRGEWEDRPAPAMPVTFGDEPYVHREHVPEIEYPFPRIVVRPVDKREMAGNPKALEAQNKAWAHLRNLKVWDETSGEAHWKNRTPGQPFFGTVIQAQRFSPQRGQW